MTEFNKRMIAFFDDFKGQFISFVDNELLTAENERKELLKVNKSKLESVVFILNIIKMQQYEAKIFKEFLQKFEKKDYFQGVGGVVKYCKKTDNKGLFRNILDEFMKIFDYTNDSKFHNKAEWIDTFSKNLAKEFLNYEYILWEVIIFNLKDERLTNFPCLNDVLKRMDKLKYILRIDEIRFAQSIGIL